MKKIGVVQNREKYSRKGQNSKEQKGVQKKR